MKNNKILKGTLIFILLLVIIIFFNYLLQLKKTKEEFNYLSQRGYINLVNAGKYNLIYINMEIQMVIIK